MLSAALCASLVDLARLSRDGAAADDGCGPRRCSDRRGDRRSGGPGGPRARPHPRSRRRARDARRVRRLRVPVLRAGRARRPRAARRLRRPPLRLAAPAADRRPSARAARGRGGRGGGRRRARSGRCTTCSSTTRARSRPGDLIGYAGELGLDAERFTRGPAARTRGAGESPTTSTAPTSAASRARRPSSSTAAATTAPTTSTRSPRRCELPAPVPRSRTARAVRNSRADELGHAPLPRPWWTAVFAGAGVAGRDLPFRPTRDWPRERVVAMALETGLECGVQGTGDPSCPT